MTQSETHFCSSDEPHPMHFKSHDNCGKNSTVQFLKQFPQYIKLLLAPAAHVTENGKDTPTNTCRQS